MLEGIRKLILEKKEFQEAAEIIFEDAVGNLDDQIVLGEEPEEKDPVTPEDDNDDLNTENLEDDDEDDSTSEVTPAPENPDIESDDVPPVEPGHSTEPEPIDGSPMPLPTADGELPTPVGKQTGEPIEDKDDLLDVSIDLKSNTIRDVLPIPPKNAGDAIGGEPDDDLLDSRIDSGFGGEENQPETPEVDMTPAEPPENIPSNEPPVEPTGEDGNEGDQELLSEAITLGNDAPAGDDTPPADSSSADTPPDAGAEPPADENPVTAAVKDKVEEITSDDGDSSFGDGPSGKDELLKKLGNITKSLEDAKKAIMNTLQ